MMTGPEWCKKGLTPRPWQQRFSIIIGIVQTHIAGLWDPGAIVSPYWDHRALTADTWVR